MFLYNLSAKPADMAHQLPLSTEALSVKAKVVALFFPISIAISSQTEVHFNIKDN